jgi:hypothetical protein
VKLRLATLLLAVVGLASLAGCGSSEPTELGSEQQESPAPDFAALGLGTDASMTSIELGRILGGGPAKDAIPALTDPEFVTVEAAAVSDNVQGILVEMHGEKRYYPYNIMVWHEIANDRIGDTPIAVTF